MRSRIFSQLDPRQRLASGALAVALAAVIGAALLPDRPAVALTAPGIPRPQPRPADACCRWELVTLVPPERYRALLEPHGPAGWAIEAPPPVLLLDQCSGRTWELGFRPGPGGHDWRLLRREGVD